MHGEPGNRTQKVSFRARAIRCVQRPAASIRISTPSCGGLARTRRVRRRARALSGTAASTPTRQGGMVSVSAVSTRSHARVAFCRDSWFRQKGLSQAGGSVGAGMSPMFRPCWTCDAAPVQVGNPHSATGLAKAILNDLKQRDIG